jgi:hypothetical protein
MGFQAPTTCEPGVLRWREPAAARRRPSGARRQAGGIDPEVTTVPTFLRGDIRRLSIPVLLVSFMLAACGGASTAGAPIAPDEAGQPAPSGAPAARDPGEQPAPGTDGDPGAPLDTAKIVRTGSLSVQMADVGAAVLAAQRAIDGLGGYVSASRQATEDDHPIAQITYRIPSDRWDEGLAALRRLGTVLDEQTDSVEVTGQLVDLEARIANLRASERALQGIAATAVKVSDVLEVQQRLFEVRGEIERLDAQRTELSDQASYGTLTVTYGVEVVAITEAAKGWNPGAEVDRATASLVDVLQGVATAGIWFAIVWLPILIVLTLLVVGVYLVLRRFGVARRPQDSPPATIAS